MIGRHKMAFFKWQGANINVVLIHACHCETKDGCAQALEEASKMAPDTTTIIAWQTEPDEIHYFGDPKVVEYLTSLPIVALPWRWYLCNDETYLTELDSDQTIIVDQALLYQ
jgi:hypothetical protein